MSIIGLLVALVLVGLLFWAARAIVKAFEIPPPIATLVYVALVILVVLWFLQQLGGLSGGPILRL